MAINFDLNDLQAFRAVVEQGSFRKAAQAISISQPALSRRVEKLEEATVERLLDDLDVALLGITDVASTRLGHVTVACVPSAAYYFMPKVIAHYHRQYPKIRIKVLDSSANDVHAAVLSGEADFGLSFTGNLQPEIEFELLVEERYVVACRRDHPLAQRTSVTWTELYQQDYISLDKTSGNRFLLDQALIRITPEKSGVCETRHVTTMIGLVEAGPTMALPGPGHPLLTGVPLVEPEVMRKVGLLKRRGRVLTPAALELERLIVEMKQSFSE